MFTFFLADMNLPFTIAICIVFLFMLLEILGLIIGLSLLEILDNLSPFDLDTTTPSAVSGGITGILDWLYINRLPMLIWLILMLTQFAIIGFSLNYMLVFGFDIQLPTSVSASLSLVLAAVLIHFLGAKLALVLPQNNAVVSSDTFSGQLAKITIGTATKGNPAEAVFTDEFNQKHYLMVEPMYEHESFPLGTEVVLVEKLSSSWLATPYQ